MHKEPCNYREYFHPGQRARVEMPLQGEEVFRDGAVVTAVGDGEIGLRLSRDQLPEKASLQPQAPLVVRIGGGGNGYSCRGVVRENPGGVELRVTLVDRVVSEDQREYFRLAIDLPVTLFNLTSGLAEEDATDGARPATGELPRIADISGGGIRTETTMAMKPGDLVYCTFRLPLTPPRDIRVVAEVVHSGAVEKRDGKRVRAGLKFVHINERERDAIIHYVCNEEMRRIRNRNRRFYSF